MAPVLSFAHGQRGFSETLKDDSDLDLLAGLWQEAPFARLPADAPDEFRQYLVEVDDPRRVYAIHRASRRHEFQSRVNMYIYQLRYGCGSPNCAVPTCFTCRKRLAGKAPIRRYSPLSARTLAVYLASQDNPDQGLCPTLNPPKEASKAVFSDITFENTRPDPMLPLDPKRPNSLGSASSPKHKALRESGSARPARSPCSESSPALSLKQDSSDSSSIRRDKSPESHDPAGEPAAYRLREKAHNKDHRSFAANLFGTVAFRMFEWLTPQGVAAISEKMENIGHTDQGNMQRAESAVSGSAPATSQTDAAAELGSMPKPPSALNGEPPEKLAPPEPMNPSPQDPTKSRRVPEAMFRSPQSSKPRKTASLEPLSPANMEESKSPTKSPRPNAFHPDKLSRSLRSGSTVSRGIPEIPAKPAFFGNLSPQHSVVKDADESTSHEEDRSEVLSENTTETSPAVSSKGHATQDVKEWSDDQVPAEIRCPLTQSLNHLDVDIIDFVCDAFQADNTAESPMNPLLERQEPCPQPVRGQNPIARRRRRNTISRRQWKAFNEQTLFHVLSNPRLLISSFAADGDIFDSHTLWYCMFRLTRTVPCLVFHSLWMAADSLFIPPRALQESGPRRSKLFKRNRNALTDFEAGCIVSICLHALAGSVPICPDKHSLRALSWVRSRGLTLSTFTDVLEQPAWIREQFDDAFSHDLAIRLARRLCCAVTARRRFSQMLQIDTPTSEDDGSGDIDILDPLFNQIDLLGLESSPVLEFAEHPRLLHQGRMQILTLEWARAVVFHDWQGRPDFATNGSFAGALSVIESMYEQRELLQLVDRDFQMDYFSDRLDSMEVPIAWVDFTSTSQRRHLLDYPYLFTPSTLVSFFRSINFSRMSRTFEESSSLKTRMGAIVDRGSLITNQHHKTVLQDMLKTASARYLVLEISRENVLRDAFDQLWQREERELLRPLKVHLGEEGGEEGFDSGGVQQEFFRMAIAEFLDANHGAFTVDERTKMAWFIPGSIVETWKFELLGLLVSLAVFNGLTLPVTFPKALYRKLLDWPVTELHHIEDGWPDLASGLTMLQEWDEKDGAVEDVFARTYEFSVSAYGSHVTRDMGSTDSDWPQFASGKTHASEHTQEAPLVTRENRDDYITDYIRFLTDVSVRPQYTAFARGFHACMEPKSVTLLNPTILQSLVEGVQDIDISELKRYARYVGWDASHRTVRDFWSIVKRYDDNMKRRLIEFVTASDRLPVGGMRNLQFVVQKNGEEEEGGHLPTAYTCYGTLLLPEYKDKETLKERLAMALENAQGFGFA